MAPRLFSGDTIFSRPFRSTWELLSETTSFINMREDAEQYQDTLRNWRRRLQEGSRDPEIQRQVRDEIVSLRKAFRKSGYDVSLGSLSIRCDGFRSETSVNEGYRRIVVLITDQEVYYEVGDGNHLNLWETLEQRTRTLPFKSREYHHLWYLWKEKVLLLSGADSEPKEAFDRFCKIVETKKLVLLSALKKLR
ncbi:MAG: hypothetical protein N2442_12585 [Spirochaetes bacterium]|nr:hypothetical protein [Spirochaetota bacterium]